MAVSSHFRLPFVLDIHGADATSFPTPHQTCIPYFQADEDYMAGKHPYKRV